MEQHELELKRRLEVGDFARNNGRILRAINILRGKWINLDTVQAALMQEMNEAEFETCIIYLEKAGYILVREIASKKIVEAASCNYPLMEVTLSKDGMDIALYFKKDDAVIV